MSRRIEKSWDFKERFRRIEFAQKVLKITRKRITPRENRQNLLLTAPILISATVFSYQDITMETRGILKISMAKLKRFWPFFAIFLPENWINSCKTYCKGLESSAVSRKQFLAHVCQVLIKCIQSWLLQNNFFPLWKPNLMILFWMIHTATCNENLNNIALRLSPFKEYKVCCCCFFFLLQKEWSILLQQFTHVWKQWICYSFKTFK